LSWPWIALALKVLVAFSTNGCMALMLRNLTIQALALFNKISPKPKPKNE
jgi:hypothetical protein